MLLPFCTNSREAKAHYIKKLRAIGRVSYFLQSHQVCMMAEGYHRHIFESTIRWFARTFNNELTEGDNSFLITAKQQFLTSRTLSESWVQTIAAMHTDKYIRVP